MQENILKKDKQEKEKPKIREFLDNLENAFND